MASNAYFINLSEKSSATSIDSPNLPMFSAMQCTRFKADLMNF